MRLSGAPISREFLHARGARQGSVEGARHVEPGTG